jgi:hypothetical protein
VLQSTEDQACFTRLEPDGTWLPTACNLAFLASCVGNSGCYASETDAVEAGEKECSGGAKLAAFDNYDHPTCQWINMCC